MHKYEEIFLKKKIEDYIDNFENPQLQENILSSLEEMTLTARDFLRISGMYLNEFEIENKKIHGQEYSELKEEYDKLEENHKKLKQNYEVLIENLEGLIKNSLSEKIKGLLNEIKKDY